MLKPLPTTTPTFKDGRDAAAALQQIKDSAYHQKYALKGKPITLVGANFDSNQRKIAGWKTDPDNGKPVKP